ncbi:MAG: hypothetical protein GYA36_08085 [Veillonellaceae bacterium]|nr:hypothetical protein [Veillonellaceae bacterium]
MADLLEGIIQIFSGTKVNCISKKMRDHRFFGREKQSEDEYTFHKAENLPNAEKDG